MASGTISSVLNLGLKIASKSKGSMKGVVGSTKKFDKSAKKGLRIKQRFRIAEMKYDKRKREEKKRRLEEEELEQQKEQRKSQKGRETDESKKKGMSLFQRLKSVITSLLLGFILNKIPIIIEKIKGVINLIKEIVDKVKKFFNGVKEFFDGVGKAIGNLFNTLKSLNVETIKEKLVDSLKSLKNIFGGLASSFLDGAKEIFKFGKKEEQEFAKEESEKNDENENEEDSQIKTSVGDAKKTLSSQTNNFNESLKIMEKEGTGAKLIPPENSNILKESIKGDLSTITFDGKTFPRGLPGSGETFDGKGGSTYGVTDEETKPEAGGTADIKPGSNEQKPQIGDKLNISKPKNKVDVSTITPERKSKNTVVVVGGEQQTSIPNGQQQVKEKVIIKEVNNSIKDSASVLLS